MSELAPVLSPGSAITLPWGNSWQQLLQRASAPRISPDYVAVVEVATEKDVQETVRSLPPYSSLVHPLPTPRAVGGVIKCRR